jgi:hypothetical protein
MPGMFIDLVIDLVSVMALTTLLVIALSVLDSESESVLLVLKLFLLVSLSRILEWIIPRFPVKVRY